MQKFFVETVARTSDTEFVVELSDATFPVGDADRVIWLGVEAKADDYLATSDFVDGSYPSADDRLVANLAEQAVRNFALWEVMTSLPVNSRRNLEVVHVAADEFVRVTVRTDHVVDGKPKEVTLQFDRKSTEPTEAPNKDSEDQSIDYDIRAVALIAANDVRSERALRRISRDSDRWHAKREAEREAARIAAQEEKRIARMASDLGCTVALARYIDGLERRIEALAGHAVRNYEAA
ncbi:hypothetical protein [Microvirga sp. G4-2]|uniref:hypothetical protein n=1 Tax=Microvirga sp. G4-2 TaxID=3434467 RepID=UPI004043E62B